MQDRQSTKWRIIYDAKWGGGFPYSVQYWNVRSDAWKEWTACMTRLGARYTLWHAKRISKPIGGEMLIHESNPDA